MKTMNMVLGLVMVDFHHMCDVAVPKVQNKFARSTVFKMDE
jgi:hypothetical protein